MSEEPTPWYRNESNRPLPPIFSNHRGYFPYKGCGIIAADPTTGDIEWISRANLQYSPCVGAETIGCPEHRSIQLVDASSGEVLGEVTYDSDFTAPPVFASQEGLYLAGCDDAHLYAKRADDTFSWWAELDEKPLMTSALSRELLIGYQTEWVFDSIDLRTGSITWGYLLPAPVSAGTASNSRWFTVGLANGVVYLFSQGNKERLDSWAFESEIIDIVMDSASIFASTEDRVCRIDAEQRQVDWWSSLDSTAESLNLTDDRLFTAAHDGSVVVYDAESGDEAFRVHGELLTETPTIGIEDNTVYIGIRGYGYAVVNDIDSQSGSIAIDTWPGSEDDLFGFLTTSGPQPPRGVEETLDADSRPEGAGQSSADDSTSPDSDSVSGVDIDYPVDTESSVLKTKPDDSTPGSMWRTSIDPSSYNATVAQEGVFVSSPSGSLEKIDAETGDSLWDVRIADVFSTKPHVHNNELVLLCGGNTLRSFDRRTGDELLRLEIPAGEWEYLKILDSVACIAARDGELLGVDLESEAVLWERSFDAPIHSPPFTTAMKFSVAIGDGLDRIDPNQGTTLLQCIIESAATATAIRDDEIYYGTTDGAVHIIDLLSLRQDGKLMFEGELRSIVSVDDALYIATGNQLHSVDPDTYETIWSESNFRTDGSAVGVYNDMIISCDTSGTVVARDRTGQQREELQLAAEDPIYISGGEELLLLQDEDCLLSLIDLATPQSLVERLSTTRLSDADTSDSDGSEQSEPDPEEKISELRDAVATKNDQLSELSDALEAKDQRIVSLEKTLEEKKERISTLSRNFNDVFEETVRPLLQCLISIHAQQDVDSTVSDELATYIEDTLERNGVSIREPSPGDEYSSTYHEKVETIEGAHPPDTIVAVQSPCYEWEFDDSILHPAEVVVSDGSNSLKSAGVVDGTVTDISEAKCVFEGTVPDAPRTAARVLSLSISEDDAASIEEFSTAVRRWEQLGTHANTVNPIAWDTDPVPWVAHEREGYEQLTDVLSTLGWDDRLSVIADVAESLRNADKYNTRHPSLDIHSVWLDTDNPDVTAAVADWGVQDVVRQTADRSWSRYAAPEQVTRDPIGSHTNIYRLGALSYHLLSGRPPFSEVTDSIETAIVEQTPVPPSEYADTLPKKVDDLILQAMASDPANRVKGAYSFQVELLDAL